jgi:predicted PurR-regulated permease PerM
MNPLRWMTLLLCVGALFVLWPLWPALLLAAWTAALITPLLGRFERALKGRRRAAAALSLLLFVVLALPLVLMAVGVVAGAQELLVTVRSSTSAASALAALTSSPSDTSATGLPTTFTEVIALAQRSGAQGLGFLTDLAGAAAKGLVGLLIYFGGAYAFLVDGKELWAWVRQNSPLEGRSMDRLGKAFHETGRGLLVGVGLTSLTQGLAATIAYLALGVSRAWVLGPLTGIASVVPVAGTALIWGPVALGLFLTGRPIKGTVLLVLGVGVISIVDNLLRPVYARMGALQMPLFLLFCAVFGGLAAFGTWGALIGPLMVRLTMEALAIARDDQSGRPGAPR